MNTTKDELNFKQLFLSGVHGAASSLAADSSSGTIIALGCLLALSIIIAAIVIFKCKRDKDALQRRYEKLQDLTLEELKTQIDQVKGQLDDIEAGRDANKTNLQLVESEITTGETTFMKPEELLKKKERLLREQWNLDETKKNYERQLLNIEKLLELVELLGKQKIRMKKETVDQSDNRETQVEGETNQAMSEEEGDIRDVP